jgi:hypothetical protein
MAKRSYPLPKVKNPMTLNEGPRLAEEVASKPGKEVKNTIYDDSNPAIWENGRKLK